MMSVGDPTQVIQCAGCESKLRVSAKALGKTIACPKCGQHMKLVDPTARAKNLVVATPIAKSAGQPQSPLAAAVSAPRPLAPGIDSSSRSQVSLTGDSPGSPNTNWANFQFPAAGSAYQPRSAKPATAGKSFLWLWITLGAGGAVMMMGVTVTLLVLWFAAKPSIASRRDPINPLPGSPAPAAPGSTIVGTPSGSAPSSPALTAAQRAQRLLLLGPGRPFGDNIVLHRVPIIRTPQRPLMLNVFVPKGQHADQSLPVMFESPSGTNLLHGAEVERPDPRTEILPFTEAGMITVTFSIDGALPNDLSPEHGPLYVLALERAYKEFVEADAGVASGKAAIDYILERLPAADPKRLYVWGHSSSATLALLLASKDPRIAKCIALAPITDLNKRLGELLTDKSAEKSLPNLSDYFRNGSPVSLVEQLKCPVFLAHARDDDNEPFRNTEAYVQALRRAGGNVTFEAFSHGGHYRELIEAALPKAVQWCQ